MTPLLLASSLPFWTCRILQPPPLARNPAGLAAAKREAAWPDAARPLKPGRVHRKRQPPELRPVEIRLDAFVACTFQSLSSSPYGDRSRRRRSSRRSSRWSTATPSGCRVAGRARNGTRHTCPDRSAGCCCCYLLLTASQRGLRRVHGILLLGGAQLPKISKGSLLVTPCDRAWHADDDVWHTGAAQGRVPV